MSNIVFDQIFKFLRPPKLNLTTPTFSLPNKFLVLALMIFSYFIVLSGIIYDVINQPPSMGQEKVGNHVRPVAILSHRLNAQYIIEGLSAGALFVIGALGFIALDVMAKKDLFSAKVKTIVITISILAIIFAYNLSIVFLKIKVPGYLH